MLPRIVLLLLQIAAAWFLAEPIKAVIPPVIGRQYDIFVYALIFAIIIMLVGFAGSLVLKNVRVPSAGTFIFSLVLALLLALVTLFPQVTEPIGNALPLLRANPKLYPFAGTLIGYLVKR